jgi:hypothetical protein
LSLAIHSSTNPGQNPDDDHYYGTIEAEIKNFTHLKCQKHIGDDIGDFKYVFTTKIIFWGVKMTSLICFIHLIMQEYDSKCLKMYLKFV